MAVSAFTHVLFKFLVSKHFSTHPRRIYASFKTDSLLCNNFLSDRHWWRGLGAGEGGFGFKLLLVPPRSESSEAWSHQTRGCRVGRWKERRTLSTAWELLGQAVPEAWGFCIVGASKVSALLVSVSWVFPPDLLTDMSPLNPCCEGCIVIWALVYWPFWWGSDRSQRLSLSASSCSYLSPRPSDMREEGAGWARLSLSRGLGPSPWPPLCSPVCAEAPHWEEQAGVLTGVRSLQNHQPSLLLMPHKMPPWRHFLCYLSGTSNFLCVEFSSRWIVSISLRGSSASQPHARTGLYVTLSRFINFSMLHISHLQNLMVGLHQLQPIET